MVYDLISIKYAIETVYRDYKHKEDLDIWDCVEWGGEALNLMGVSMQYVDCIKTLEVENYRVCLPKNFHALNQITYKSVRLPLLGGTIGLINTGQFETEATGKIVNLLQDSPLHTTTSKLNDGYYINDGFIITSFETGEIVISYKAIPLDDEGFPKIPNLESYKKAISAYIQLMLDRQDWRAGKLADKVYVDSQMTWKKYCNMAKAEAKFPDLDTMENIRKHWVALRPGTNRAETFYN